MKKIIYSLAILVAATFMTNNLNAQFEFSSGLEIALPMGDFADVNSIGFGVSVGGEYGLNDNISADLQVGYIYLTVADDVSDFVKSSYMIPAQAGVRYYVDQVGNGLYVKGLIGIHNYGVTPEGDGDTESDTNLSFGGGLGYCLNETIDIGLRLNVITSSEDEVDATNYIGLRAAYKFGMN